MKNFFEKLWSFIKDERNEKAIIIALPCLALLISALILVPQISALSSRGAAADPETIIETPTPDANAPSIVTTAPETKPSTLPVITAPETSATPSVSPSASPSSSGNSGGTTTVKTKLYVRSDSENLYITVCNSNGKAISGYKFTISVKYPDGNTYKFQSDTDGDCYLVKIASGDYTVSMGAQSIYSAASSVTKTVGSVEYKPIEDIEAVVEIKDVTQVPADEVKPGSDSSAPSSVIAEAIVTPSTVIGSSYVLDANGNKTYTYEYKLGPNGYLLKKGTTEESNVIPIDENGDGVYDYGQYFVSEGQYNMVDLYKSDNTPVDDFEIIATPIVSNSESNVGWQTINGKTYYYDAGGNPVVGLKKIDGKIYYFDINGVKASSVGIDVSYYNTSIDWQQVKAQGIDFAIVRIGGRTWRTGELYDDTCAKEYLQGARNAGLKVGAYFYSTAITEQEAVEEASVALKTLSELNNMKLDYPLFIDMEYSGIQPDGRADNLTPAQRTKIVTAFCETVINGGYTAGVYSGQNFFNNAMEYDNICQYPIWLASYTANNKLPAFYNRYDIWQFTDRAQIDGISGDTDMNVIF